MNQRLEFSKKVRLEIFRRAGGPEKLYCEGCGLPLRGKPFEIDHTIECWEKPTRTELTADDGKLLGYCCHRPKTAKKATERAHGNRIIEKSAKAKSKGPPIPGSRSSKFKKTVSGKVTTR